MAGIDRPILLDADAIICLLEWDCYGKACKKLGDRGCVAEYVAEHELKGHKERGTGRWIPFPKSRITETSQPKLISPHALEADQYAEYMQHFVALEQADAGERETFALAWVLGYDVCSRDVNARALFREHRPPDCTSKNLDVMVLLRRLKLA